MQEVCAVHAKDQHEEELVDKHHEESSLKDNQSPFKMGPCLSLMPIGTNTAATDGFSKYKVP